jgi:hypothetical protein
MNNGFSHADGTVNAIISNMCRLPQFTSIAPQRFVLCPEVLSNLQLWSANLHFNLSSVFVFVNKIFISFLCNGGPQKRETTSTSLGLVYMPVCQINKQF